MITADDACVEIRSVIQKQLWPVAQEILSCSGVWVLAKVVTSGFRSGIGWLRQLRTERSPMTAKMIGRHHAVGRDLGKMFSAVRNAKDAESAVLSAVARGATGG
jgi:hypothetical protein